MSIVSSEIDDKCSQLAEDIAIFEELLWEFETSDMEDKHWAREQLMQQLEVKRQQLAEIEERNRSVTKIGGDAI